MPGVKHQPTSNLGDKSGFYRKKCTTFSCPNKEDPCYDYIGAVF
jgi:hypothetical protein